MTFIERYLESVHPAKIGISFLFIIVGVLAMLVEIGIPMRLKELVMWQGCIGLVLILLGNSCIVYHLLQWRGLDLPFPLSKGEHFGGHEYYGGILSVIGAAIISGQYIGLGIILLGFVLGFRRGWNFGSMEKRILE